MGKRFIVYRATNLRNGKFYIGFTSKKLSERASAHIKKSKGKERGCPKFHNAIMKHGPDAFYWEEMGEFPTPEEALAEEVRLIAELKPEYNITAGGEGTVGIEAWNRRPVTCLDDGNIFPSATCCAEHYGASVATITDVCRGKYRSFEGKHFVYGAFSFSDEERALLIKKIEKEAAQRRKRVVAPKNYRGIVEGLDERGRRANGPAKLSRQVICLDDGMIFPSASAAARHYLVCRSSIIELCLGKNGRVSAGGLKFKYLEEAA